MGADRAGDSIVTWAAGLPQGSPAECAPRHGVDGDADFDRRHRRHRVVVRHDFSRASASSGPSERHGVWRALLDSDAIYLEVCGRITVFVLAGRYFEARAKSKAGSALRRWRR